MGRIRSAIALVAVAVRRSRISRRENTRAIDFLQEQRPVRKVHAEGDGRAGDGEPSATALVAAPRYAGVRSEARISRRRASASYMAPGEIVAPNVARPVVLTSEKSVRPSAPREQ